MSRVVPGLAADAVQREELAMRRMTESLVEDLSENVPVDQVTSAVGAAHHRFTDKPIREFVPILVERIVRRELADPDPTVRIPAPSASVRASELIARESNTTEKQTERLVSRRAVVPLSLGAVVVVAAVVAGVVLLPAGADAPAAAPVAAAAVVRGVVGSEKMSFFADERVVKVLADNGIRVEVEPAGFAPDRDHRRSRRLRFRVPVQHSGRGTNPAPAQHHHQIHAFLVAHRHRHLPADRGPADDGRM